ncbi:ribosomal protein S18-alanine N-acetyltransferase [Pseudodesulfovibrio sediminis]|uniref:[Ribosomal protein bS18]-alanine N-acetyltransferase n=1 Tax=Pseudodesulfovibrio sediminis TaxID=2810563 RepID=A0ABM7P2T9_9BACT|nr:ribosomal protein S18-alanine N-acetyltransferase [Pseudodesulfovibrio sediminis]BCS87153.1 ribosomal-protein-alanine acetyltransferase [Pseudodesulfovibrio sediminis]
MIYEPRELGEADIEDLIELERACFNYHWTREQFLLGLNRKAFKILGIKTAAGLVGYMAFSLIEDEMEILNLGVRSDYRRHGLAARLLQKSFDICVESGIRKSFLDVKASNEPALALYRKFGYKQIGVRKKYYPDTKEDALLFRHDFPKDS